ncbi:hypothetical protein Tco_0109805 [Tanacetum coccineum]
MIWIAASKAFSITFTVLVITASLECLFVVPRLSHKSTSSLKELLEVSQTGHVKRAEATARRGKKEEERCEIEMIKQLKMQQEEVEKEEKEQRSREKEEAEQKKELALQKHAL